jgi:hypothetical protein
LRADLGLIGLDQDVKRGRVDIALFHQQRFQRPHPELDLGEFGMVVIVVMVVIVRHEGSVKSVVLYR